MRARIGFLARSACVQGLSLNTTTPNTMADPPPTICCPITCDVMSDPVILAETCQTYERAAIERWLATNLSCPITGVQLLQDPPLLLPNIAMRSAIEELQLAAERREDAEARAVAEAKVEARAGAFAEAEAKSAMASAMAASAAMEASAASASAASASAAGASVAAGRGRRPLPPTPPRGRRSGRRRQHGEQYPAPSAASSEASVSSADLDISSDDSCADDADRAEPSAPPVPSAPSAPGSPLSAPSAPPLGASISNSIPFSEIYLEARIAPRAAGRTTKEVRRGCILPTTSTSAQTRVRV